MKNGIRLTMCLAALCAWLTAIAASGTGTGAANHAAPRSIRAYFPFDHYMQHVRTIGRVDAVRDEQSQRDAEFRIVPGLAGVGCVSFESTNARDHYLRHSEFRIVLSKYEEQKRFREDSTFCMGRGLLSRKISGTEAVSFRSFNFPDRFIRHRDAELWLDPFETTWDFQSHATFYVTDPATPTAVLDLRVMKRGQTPFQGR